MATLLLKIKKEYFDQIKSGTKRIEYRDCTDYWVTRLVEDVENSGDEENEKIIYKTFEKIVFICGKDKLQFKHTGTVLDADDGVFQIYFEP